MSEIKIVGYQPKYASALAEMWNKSGSNWGGFDLIHTEEMICQEMETSTNLHNWLALDGDEVVGFCSFSEYREDEGASYIPLLNVRPDYHNRKVGKTLVLEAVKRAVKMGWPRLDLYTWPGNTKAVPLYKKCGFVWERRDDSTHLMNFIPTIMGTEAVADYFDLGADWYRDSTRELDVQPDDKRVNGFDYYVYSWQHQGQELRMEFERRARGLRLIETQDYLVSCEAEQPNLPFGQEYTVRYTLVNKSGKPLHVAIKGQDDKCLSFNLEFSGEVTNEQEVEGTFRVNPIVEDQDPRRTHPAITAAVYINGKRALFRLGVAPKFPAKLDIILPDAECYLSQQGELYLDIVNNFNCQASFSLRLPETEWLALPSRELDITLAAGQRDSLTLPFTLKDFGFYAQNIPVQARLVTGQEVSFVLRLSQGFAGAGACFGGETDKFWEIYNGRYKLALSKFSNVMLLSALTKDPYQSYIFYPQAGHPWSAEFSKRRPEGVEWHRSGGDIILEAIWHSSDFPGLEIAGIARLSADGLVEHKYQGTNRSDAKLKPLSLKHGARIPFHRSVLPVEGKIIEIENAIGDGGGYWPATSFSENWIFSDTPNPRGLVWPRDSKPISEWDMIIIEHDLGSLVPGQTVKTKSIWLSAGAYKTWQELRRFARGVADGEPSPEQFFALKVNDNNPFVGPSFSAEVIERRNTVLAGNLELKATNDSFPLARQVLAKEQALRQTRFEITLAKTPPLEQVRLKADLEAFAVERKSLVFPLSGQVSIKTESLEGRQIWSANNGPLTIKACPSHSNALYALEWEGTNWLDNSFPTIGPKSWWNPWLGGIAWSLTKLTFRTILASPRRAEAAELRDSKGNLWQGISMVTTIQDNEDYRGLEVRQNFLLLPGAPVLAVTSEIRQNSGRGLHEVDFENEYFFAPGGKVKGSWNLSRGFREDWLKAKVSDTAVDVDTKDAYWLGNAGHPGEMMVIFGGRLYATLNAEVNGGFSRQVLTVPQGKTIFTKPIFLLLSQQHLDLEMVRDLKGLSF